MAIASDFLQSLVPISQFNKGQAAKIFDRLRSEKELIVLKNNQPSAIIFFCWKQINVWMITGIKRLFHMIQ